VSLASIPSAADTIWLTWRNLCGLYMRKDRATEGLVVLTIIVVCCRLKCVLLSLTTQNHE
jgi:hypothetical protein